VSDTPSGYGGPGAFRRALTDRLRALSQESQWTLAQLQRQFAYDRLLERLNLVDDGWIVKGAAALLARDLGVRATIDVDLYRARPSDVAEAELREAAARDIGDWFRFEVGAGRPTGDGDAGVRLPTTAYVGPTPWSTFHVDLVGSDLRMTGEPDEAPPLARVLMPNIEQNGYRVYPLVDHVADKVVATFQRYGRSQRPSTRYRDLVDLVCIVTGASVSAKPQLAALRSEAGRRAVTLAAMFDVPDRAMWEPGYAAEAKRSLLPIARDLDEALAVVCPFIDPLLNETASGRWNRHAGRWVS
jgi:hypothetical protein